MGPNQKRHLQILGGCGQELSDQSETAGLPVALNLESFAASLPLAKWARALSPRS